MLVSLVMMLLVSLLLPRLLWLLLVPPMRMIVMTTMMGRCAKRALQRALAPLTVSSLCILRPIMVGCGLHERRS